MDFHHDRKAIVASCYTMKKSQIQTQICCTSFKWLKFKFSAISSLQRCIHIITRPRRRAHPVNFSRNLILSPLFRIKCRLVVFTFDVVMTSATEQKLSAVNIPNGKRCNLFWNTVQHLFSSHWSFEGTAENVSEVRRLEINLNRLRNQAILGTESASITSSLFAMKKYP